jgi:hypothetical protein
MTGSNAAQPKCYATGSGDVRLQLHQQTDVDVLK